ncbi:hypothetical protein [Nocardia nova]|uniref:hypothetical protein n=1 Tax=Nocardia nova TaxID=37330 RepID=UPI0027395154|nr:hypothetical protein [Nocardia nova]
MINTQRDILGLVGWPKTAIRNVAGAVTELRLSEVLVRLMVNELWNVTGGLHQDNADEMDSQMRAEVDPWA